MPFIPSTDYDDPPTAHRNAPQQDRIWADGDCGHSIQLFESERASHEKTGVVYCLMCHALVKILRFRLFGEQKKHGGKA
jgi:hypothetical protein